MEPKTNTVILQLSTGKSIQRLVLSKQTKYLKRWLENYSKPIIYYMIVLLRLGFSARNVRMSEGTFCHVDVHLRLLNDWAS